MMNATTGSGPLDAGDANVLTSLNELYTTIDPVPTSLSERLKYAMTVRMLEAEVAELTAIPTAMVRGEVGERVDNVSFAGSSMSLMVSLSTEPAGVRVDCWVTVPGALVQVRTSGSGDAAEQERTADEQGRCEFTDLPAGPAHFVVWAVPDRSSRPIITPTITL